MVPFYVLTRLEGEYFLMDYSSPMDVVVTLQDFNRNRLYEAIVRYILVFQHLSTINSTSNKYCKSDHILKAYQDSMTISKAIIAA